MSENIAVQRGKDKTKLRELSPEVEQDGELVNGHSALASQQEEAKAEQSPYDGIDVVNGDFGPDDEEEEFDFEKAKRDSEASFVHERKPQSTLPHIDFERLKLKEPMSEDTPEYPFWSGVPHNWEDLEDEEIENIDIQRGKMSPFSFVLFA